MSRCRPIWYSSDTGGPTGRTSSRVGISPTSYRPSAYMLVVNLHYVRHRAQIPFRHRALDLALRVALLDRPALVVEVLALRDRDLDLRARPVPVQARGHDRQALLGSRAEQPIDLAAVEQQLAGALGVVVVARRLVGGDVHVAQPHLAVAHLGVGVLQLGPAFAERLPLGALEHDPRL